MKPDNLKKAIADSVKAPFSRKECLRWIPTIQLRKDARRVCFKVDTTEVGYCTLRTWLTDDLLDYSCFAFSFCDFVPQDFEFGVGTIGNPNPNYSNHIKAINMYNQRYDSEPQLYNTDMNTFEAPVHAATKPYRLVDPYPILPGDHLGFLIKNKDIHWFRARQGEITWSASAELSYRENLKAYLKVHVEDMEEDDDKNEYDFVEKFAFEIEIAELAY